MASGTDAEPSPGGESPHKEKFTPRADSESGMNELLSGYSGKASEGGEEDGLLTINEIDSHQHQRQAPKKKKQREKRKKAADAGSNGEETSLSEEKKLRLKIVSENPVADLDSAEAEGLMAFVRDSEPPAHRSLIVDAKACKAIEMCMRRATDHVAVQVTACEAIWNLAFLPENCQRVIDAQMTELLLEFMGVFYEDPVFLEKAIGALGAICSIISGQKKMAALQAEQAICSILGDTPEGNPGFERLNARGCMFVAQFGDNNIDNIKLLLECEAKANILKCISSFAEAADEEEEAIAASAHEPHPDLCESALLALAVLAQDAEVAKGMSESDDLFNVCVTIMKANGDSRGVQQQGCALLRVVLEAAGAAFADKKTLDETYACISNAMSSHSSDYEL